MKRQSRWRAVSLSERPIPVSSHRLIINQFVQGPSIDFLFHLRYAACSKQAQTLTFRSEYLSHYSCVGRTW